MKENETVTSCYELTRLRTAVERVRAFIALEMYYFVSTPWGNGRKEVAKHILHLLDGAD